VRGRPASYSGRMDIRPLGFAAWIAAVIAVAACSPGGEDRRAAGPDAAATRMADAGQDKRAQAAGTSPDSRIMGAAPEPAPAAPASDAQITAQVRAGLEAAQDLRGARIDVDTQGGVVTLSGSVPSAAVKARASEIAKGVRDVRSVNDQLTMTSG
jgi:hyperosmotically inducible periplasmic protein